MKAIKVLLAVIFVVILLVVGGIFVALMNLNPLVEDAVTTYGPKVTQTPVKLSSVNINVWQGATEIKGFEIANPKGFSAPYVFKSDVFRVNIDPLSVTSDVIVINDITIDGVSLVAEQKGLTTNIQALIKSVQQFAPADSSGGETPATAQESASTFEPRFILNNLRFANNDLQLITEKYGNYTVNIPELTRQNLTGGGKGLTPSELGVAILQPILDAAEKAAKQKLKDVAKKEVEDKLKNKLEEKLNDSQKDKIDKLKNLLGR